MNELKKAEGIQAVRYNLSANPNSFVWNSKVTEILQEKGMNSLPITVVNDEVIKIGSYPSNKEIMDYTGLQLITIWVL